MVSYWKKKEKERAYITYGKEGQIQMVLDNEKYPIEHFPRGHILGEAIGKLKHYIKNQIFNYGWDNPDKVVSRLKNEILDRIVEMVEERRHLIVPPERMSPAIREIWRAWTEVEKGLSGKKRKQSEGLKKALCFVATEDDSYKYRIQYLAGTFNWLFRLVWFKTLRKEPVDLLDKGLKLMEHAEIVEDMKLRIRLLRTVLMTILEDKTIRDLFNKFFKEMSWSKVKLTKGDKFHFRAKWFKCDYPYFDY